MTRARGFGSVGLLAAAIVCAWPASASAHVGRHAPVGTDFEARITDASLPAGIVGAKVVDGDRELWLRVQPDASLVIPGALGEPLLRFDPAGVFVNERSLTAESDRIDRTALHPTSNPHDRPVWHRLTARHEYLWHEHRLHALEPLAHGTSGVVGRWSVPLLLDGRPRALRGELVYTAAGPWWPSLLLACAVGVLLPAARRLVAVSPTFIAALVAIGVVWTLRVGRELYGRPDVGYLGFVEIGLTSAVGLGLLYGLLHRDREVREFTALLVGVGSLYQGLTMLGVLTHSIALTTLPTTVARVGTAVSLGLGAGLLAVAVGGNRTPSVVQMGRRVIMDRTQQ